MASHIIKGSWTPPKGLVCRIRGDAALDGKTVPWSLILKVADLTDSHFVAWHREPFQREALLYRSGILDDLPGGIAAPRCLGVVTQPNDEPWMWLEDVTGVHAIEWPVEMFGRVAHQFGTMQGAFLSGAPLPDHSWLDTRAWIGMERVQIAERLPPIVERFASHPLTTALHRSDFGTRLSNLWADHEVFFDALERMPVSLCHGDFNLNNFVARSRRQGEDRLFVFDWQYAGLRQIGADIAGLIADSSIVPVRRKVAEPEEFTELIICAYLDGLKDGGWRESLDIPRLSCLVRLAMSWSFCLALGLDGGVLTRPLSDDSRADLEEHLDRYVRRQQFLFGLADEARALLEALRY